MSLIVWKLPIEATVERWGLNFKIIKNVGNLSSDIHLSILKQERAG